MLQVAFCVREVEICGCMHPEHSTLLAQIRAAGGPPKRGKRDENDSYTGSGHIFYGVSVPERRRIAKTWLAQHRNWPASEVLGVVESLLTGASHEEKTLAALLLGYSGSARRVVRPRDVELWLEQLCGWAEVDSLCQNVFPAEQLLAQWRAWRALIKRLSRDSNINKRRASIVLLTGPMHRSSDERLRDVALEVIEGLSAERDILITKAISWLLRSMVTHHRMRVRQLLDTHARVLPKIAIRETRTKLDTGRKTKRRAQAASGLGPRPGSIAQ
jgi:3-methyladenine DNA glycosylase AlkD